jgi:hypothetical protein
LVLTHAREHLWQLMMDDQLWYQAMLTDRNNRERREYRFENSNQEMLWSLIHMGVSNEHPGSVQLAPATWAMRHLSAMADRLWQLLQEQTERVRSTLGAS